QILMPDGITNLSTYNIIINASGFEILDVKTEQTFNFKEHSTYSIDHDLPFNLKLDRTIPFQDIKCKTFIDNFNSKKNATLNLKRLLEVEPIGEQSDLLKVSIKGESTELTEAIINSLVEIFNQDGISDRRLVSKRTLEFIDDRFEFLALELDSIEVDFKDFKQQNNLIDIETDAQIGLEKRTKSDEEVFRLNNQLALAKLIQEALRSPNSELLPANFGLESSNINTLIADYNTAVLDRDKLKKSAGENNPSVQIANTAIADLKLNIENSLKAYISQLETSQNQLELRNKRLVGEVAQIPEKEKLLRSIAREQKIKESLYLLLLQKREEAAINYAITEPSIKVVEYALSGSKPISPKPNIVYAGALLGGLLIPFGILYLIFMLDTKLHSKDDINTLSPKIPVVGEIPDLKKKKNTIFNDPSDRSALAESFRILSSNVNYILPLNKDNKGRVIFCTSTIKGEGKTLVSLNLSLALSSINRKVLLIGADLRNPQIHTHIAENKQKPGLSNFLHDANYNWKDALISGFEKHPNHQIILSGSIPPNPAHLLTNGRFEKLLEEAREEYDYVVVDTAPTILVTDTLLISQLADATIYLARANYTEKNLLKFSKELEETGKLKNMAYVLNSVGAGKSYGYGYNYGYNYGYGSDED
ncbi:MAG: polysaccharide biosynthesis tyrosine autokinase, partial [Winogradskyella sp.]|uniref:GumC family protein n=1 Tax=Winogradskyella sp. TaxID=1883156 RepID=UPI0025CF8D4D